MFPIGKIGILDYSISAGSITTFHQPSSNMRLWKKSFLRILWRKSTGYHFVTKIKPTSPLRLGSDFLWSKNFSLSLINCNRISESKVVLFFLYSCSLVIKSPEKTANQSVACFPIKNTEFIVLSKLYTIWITLRKTEATLRPHIEFYV